MMYLCWVWNGLCYVRNQIGYEWNDKPKILGHLAHNAIKKVLSLMKCVVMLKLPVNQVIEIMCLIEACMA